MHLLLVEDNPADTLLVKTGFELIHSQHDLHFAADGAEAKLFLMRQGAFQNAPRPHLILLDLNMPRMDGRELLKFIRETRSLAYVPVVVLTTTDSAADLELCYRLGANSFVTKPSDLQDFFALIRSIDSFWLRFCSSPVVD